MSVNDLNNYSMMTTSCNSRKSGKATMLDVEYVGISYCIDENAIATGIEMPQSIVFGKNKDYGKEDVFMMSGKSSDGTWYKSSPFVRLTGFKPWTSRNCEAEIMKTLTQGVFVEENKFVEGFKLVGFGRDKCSLFDKTNYNSAGARRTYFVMDPRNYVVEIDKHNFDYLMATSGMNIKDGLIPGEFAWCFIKGDIRLVSKNDDVLCLLLEKSRLKNEQILADKKAMKFVSPKDMKSGNFYRGIDGRVYLYMGQHDVWSLHAHEHAINYPSEGYDEKNLLKNDFSGNSHVFYKCEVIQDSLHYPGRVEHKLTYKNLEKGDLNNSSYRYSTVSLCPYFYKKTISKLFLSELSDAEVKAKNYKMYNSDKDVTYRNVLEDMSRNVLFHRLDFYRFKLDISSWTTKLMDFAVFKYATYCQLTSQDEFNQTVTWPNIRDNYFSNKPIICKYHPCANRCGKMTIRTYNNKGITKLEIIDNNNSYYALSRSVAAEFDIHPNSVDDDMRVVYDKYKPQVVQLYLDNGNTVCDAVSMYFYWHRHN